MHDGYKLEMEAVDEGCEWTMQIHTCSLRTRAAAALASATALAWAEAKPSAIACTEAASGAARTATCRWSNSAKRPSTKVKRNVSPLKNVYVHAPCLLPALKTPQTCHWHWRSNHRVRRVYMYLVVDHVSRHATAFLLAITVILFVNITTRIFHLAPAVSFAVLPRSSVFRVVRISERAATV
jgi:hypothetical protein